MLHVYQSLGVVGNTLDEAATEHLLGINFICLLHHAVMTTHRLQSAQSQEQAFVAGFQLNAALLGSIKNDIEAVGTALPKLLIQHENFRTIKINEMNLFKLLFQSLLQE